MVFKDLSNLGEMIALSVELWFEFYAYCLVFTEVLVSSVSCNSKINWWENSCEALIQGFFGGCFYNACKWKVSLVFSGCFSPRTYTVVLPVSLGVQLSDPELPEGTKTHLGWSWQIVVITMTLSSNTIAVQTSWIWRCKFKLKMQSIKEHYQL